MAAIPGDLSGACDVAATAQPGELPVVPVLRHLPRRLPGAPLRRCGSLPSHADLSVPPRLRAPQRNPGRAGGRAQRPWGSNEPCLTRFTPGAARPETVGVKRLRRSLMSHVALPPDCSQVRYLDRVALRSPEFRLSLLATAHWALLPPSPRSYPAAAPDSSRRIGRPPYGACPFRRAPEDQWAGG